MPFGRSIVATQSTSKGPDIHPVVLLPHPEIQSERRFVDHGMEWSVKLGTGVGRSNAIGAGDAVDWYQELPVQTIGLILGNFDQHAPSG